jgi:hypothetical protein
MARVEVSRHLKRYFPQLEGDALELGGATVREVLDALEARAPGIGFYLCDERGRLRQHVNVFIEDERVLDRTYLADPVGPGSRVFILQALSGG